MDFPLVISLVLTVFIGAVIQTVSGFGFGIFVMCLFPFFLPSYITSAIVSNMFSVVLALFILIKMYRHIKWKSLVFTCASYFVISVFMVIFQKNQADAFLKKLLGVFLIGMSIYFFLSKKNHKINPTPKNALIAGAISGVTGGLFGAGGPPVVVYFLSATENNDEYIATIQTFFMLTCGYLIIVRSINGLFTLDCLKYWSVGLLALVPGVLIGTRLRKIIKPELLKKLVYVFMGLSGAVMLF